MIFDKNKEGSGNEVSRLIRKVPLLPLRDIIVFPHMVVPLYVGRKKSVAALEHAMANDKDLLLIAQKRAKINDPTSNDIYEIGTLGTIIQLLRLPDSTVKLLVEGKKRARSLKYDEKPDFFLCEIEELVETLTPEPGITLTVRPAGVDLGPPERNLAVRAAELGPPLRGQPPGVALTLVKRIPVGAGMGGGRRHCADGY
jgi:Lon protease-like protein